MPAGTLETEPVPDPALVTLSLCFLIVKFAVHFLVEVMVTSPLLSQSPVQPLNTELVSGLAASVTAVP